MLRDIAIAFVVAACGTACAALLWLLLTGTRSRAGGIGVFAGGLGGGFLGGLLVGAPALFLFTLLALRRRRAARRDTSSRT